MAPGNDNEDVSVLVFSVSFVPLWLNRPCSASILVLAVMTSPWSAANRPALPVYPRTLPRNEPLVVGDDDAARGPRPSAERSAASASA